MAKSTDIVKAGNASVYPVSSEQTLKASKALLAHMKKAAKESAETSSKKNILEDDDGTTLSEQPIWLSVTTKRHVHDTNKLKPGRIALPHPLNTDPERTICLIVAEPQRTYKDIVASDEFPQELAKRITRVVDLKHLKAKFRMYEAQRKLFSEHDVFLADDRVINRLPKALGKTFYKTTAKRPIPVVLTKKAKKDEKAQKAQSKKNKAGDGKAAKLKDAADMAREVEAALGSALVHLSPSTQTAVKFGYASWPAADLAANAEAVAKALVGKFVSRGWANVRAVYLKGNETAALPVWQTDELWLEAGRDVLAEGSEELKALEERKERESERANVGKKRKALGDVPEAAGEGKEGKQAARKKAKKIEGAAAAVPKGDDRELDRQIKERKERLKKQKKAAKAAMES